MVAFSNDGSHTVEETGGAGTHGLAMSVTFSLDGSLLASGSFDHTAVLWGIPRRDCRDRREVKEDEHTTYHS
jgi:WD40 repeat protein